MSQDKYRFNHQDREAVYRAIGERRDMRHFIADPIDQDILQRLFQAAWQAPSVGLMQPWRMIRITDTGIRNAIHQIVENERVLTAKALGERETEFLQLKVEGIKDCAEVLVVSLMDKRESHIFGRRTLPEMDLASVSCAIQNMWLAARAEGLGMGWVSLFDPQKLADLLGIPNGACPVAILCLGHVDDFYQQPMLEQENWRQRQPLDELIFENRWENNTKS
ncbi:MULTISPECIES: 5,6-dimethylbenzimidazole synthase [unclassified Methylophaga]|jgi:5,6-dimethylbenzimidazole synthase|uniref:5,6-dimethylbenzimidazole synthase n=1 Tax=unclassified Methylophaga TaxID=2629249 RepID=UPI000C5003BF|nr:MULTISPECIES: 5,6-dimethylbenzimidazole synthase [unclassified Methylophaga]MAL48998.1 5,6-dimethylbenzimidazole synthase [Methylophaga sp.]MBP25268.1 5,6-dimethylbenzimidazole synthase [Methylophaga sp.]|tara:strand:+ start:5261 stop:5923 length:663 start_codon:yes stop_codon:yes gene_type:complete